MTTFNNIISHLGLIEPPLKGRSYTWSNMQDTPLLEQVDWFFTYAAWTNSFPHTLVVPLARITSDHLPCKVQIGTAIPKANIFRFENWWLIKDDCLQKKKFESWQIPVNSSNSAHIITAKFKLLRRVLNFWARICLTWPSLLQIPTWQLLFWVSLKKSEIFICRRKISEVF